MMEAETVAARSGRVFDQLRASRAFWGVVAGAFLLLAAGYPVPSFWYDEAATLQLARLPVADMFAFAGQRDAVHLAYALFMHGWIGIFGESELSVRLPSVVASALAAGGVFLLTRRLGGEYRAAVLAALVFVLLPRTMIQAVEARSYAIAVALLVGAALLALRSSRTGRLRDRIGYVLLAAAAIWCFAYVVLALPALGLLMAQQSPSVRRRAVIVAAAVSVPCVPAAPLLLAIVGQRGQVAWLETQVVNAYTVGVESFFGWAVWLAVGAIAVLAVGVRRGALRWGGDTVALFTWLILPGLVLLLLGLMTQPLFAPRYLAISTPALAVLIGLAVRGWSRRAVIATGIVWAIAAAPFVVSTRMPSAKPSGIDLRAVATVIHDGSEPGDGFLLGSEGTGALRPRVALAAYPAMFAGRRDITFVRSYAETGTYWDEVRMPTVGDLTEMDRIWVAARGDDPYAAVLTQAGFTASAPEVVTGVEVVLWQR